MLTGLSGLSGLSGVLRGGSVAPPAITVAVDGLDATIMNTGGAATSINWGDGTTNTSLTHTYAAQGVYTVTVTNTGGSSTATAIVSLANYQFSDGSGTTLTDSSGNGYNGTLGAAGAAPAWSNGGLTFDGGDRVTIPVPIADVKTVVYYGTQTSASSYNVVLSSDSASGLMWGISTNAIEGGATPFIWVGGVGEGQRGSYDSYNRPGGNGAAWTQDGVYDKLYTQAGPCFNRGAGATGIEVTAGAGGYETSATARVGNLVIGANPGNGGLNPFVGTMTGMVLFDVALSAAQVALILPILRATAVARGVANYANAASGRQVWVLGDSISTNVPVATSWPTTAEADYAQSYTTNNFSVSGRTMSVWGVAGLSRVIQRHAAGAAKNVLCIFAGTNDPYSFGYSPAATFALLNSLVTAAVTAGFNVVVAPMISRTSAGAAWTATTMDVWKNDYNTLIYAAAPGWGANVRVIPLSAFAGLVGDGDYANGNFQDGAHPTQTATTNILAPAFVTEVDAFG